MTTVLSKSGQIVLPLLVRQKLRLSPGEEFDVTIKDEEMITLRRVSRPPNWGLADLLLACPSSFKISERETDDTAPPAA
ncbi:MAG: AbrB/MazE/SpoVT family DNA-binding domain-containing protein [Chthoniobacter sp.]